MTRDNDTRRMAETSGSVRSTSSVGRKASPTGVTQADRLAAAAELERNGRLDDASDMRRGMLDHFELVQAFARHRQPYIDALKEARPYVATYADENEPTAKATLLLTKLNELIGEE